MRKALFEASVVMLSCCAMLYGMLVIVADQGRPAPGSYTDKERGQLNWLVMKHTREINGKFQGRVTDG